MSDPRIAKLEALAFDEGFRLPMAADLIAYFERQGYVVDLRTGEVCRDISVTVEPSAPALCHLYGVDDADLGAIFGRIEEDAVDVDLLDYDGELEDYENDMLDREDWARGGW
jgi:hypothetical protein